MRKKLYLAQTSARYGDNVYFPLSVGLLFSYAKTFPEFNSSYDFGGFLYIKESIDLVLSKLENPDIVGISCYVWNFEWNKAFAKAIKSKFPNCQILVGGIQIEDGSPKTLLENPYFDFAIYGEGEGPFVDFLLEYGKENPDYSKCKSLIYRQDGEVKVNPRRPFTDLNLLKSPYLDGSFDEIYKQETGWVALVETVRGCPFACNFCLEEGSLITTKNGSKKIEDITSNDLVLGWDEKTYKLSWCKVKESLCTGIKPTVKISMGGISVGATEEHEFYTSRGWIQARDLREGYEVLSYFDSISWVEVDQITQNGEKKVYDLINVTPTHNFFCNGILVHNCAWGQSALTKLRQFPEERILQEFEWLGTHNVGYFEGADANWGILKRDIELTKALAKTNKKYGYPKKFRVSFTKNSNDTVWNIANILSEVGMLKSVTLAMQSMDTEVLTSIKRKNIKFDHFGELIKKYEQAGLSTYTELIMGLPSETLETYINGIEKNLEAGQHTGLFMYMNMMLPNTEQNRPEYIQKHGLKTKKMQMFLFHHTPDPSDIVEMQDTVVETSSLPFEDWKKSWMFSEVIGTFHSLGLLRKISQECYETHGFRYVDFYGHLINWMENNPESVAGVEYLRMGSVLERILNGGSWNCIKPKFGEISWPPNEFAFLHITENWHRFYDEIKEFLETLNLECITEELISEQRNYLELPKNGDEVVWAREKVWYGRKELGNKKVVK